MYSSKDCFCLKRKYQSYIQLVKKDENSKKIEAFGERKTLYNWAKDSRCKIKYKTLWYRMKYTKQSLEQAMKE